MKLTDAMNSQTFCPYPFMHLSTKPNGEVRACCRSTKLGDIQESGLKEIWNGERMRKLRRDLLSDKQPGICKACWKDEDLGIRSLRKMAIETVLDDTDLTQLGNDYSMPMDIKFLELKLSNLCNFKCRMCYPTDSSLWGTDWPAISDLYKKNNPETYDYLESIDITRKPYISEFKQNSQFWETWEEIKQHVTKLQFAGGEPLIDPMHYDIIQGLSLEQRSRTRLSYSTNLSKIEYKGINLFELWKTFKSINVEVSIDGYAMLYEYIRTNGNYEELWQNIKTITQLPNLRLTLKICISAFNALKIDSILEDFNNKINELQLEKRPTILQSFVKYPVWLNASVLPQSAAMPAISRMSDSQSRFDGEDARLIISNTIRALSTKNDIHDNHWQDFVRYTTALDNTRPGPKFLDICPELSNFMQ